MSMTDPGAYLSTLSEDPNGPPGKTAGGVAVGRPMGGPPVKTAGNTKAVPPYLVHPSTVAQSDAMFVPPET